MVTIIVLLILAGVSLNAIIGENGIITKAQKASILNSCAVLQEYLNETYAVRKIDDRIGDSGAIEEAITPVDEMIKLYPEYFFYNGYYDYAIFEYEHKDSSGAQRVDFLKIRLINKQNLDESIRKQLVGGDAGGNKRESYLQFQDVYGVTEDLEVFYCENGIMSAIGANCLNSGYLDASKVIYDEESALSKALGETTGTSNRNLTLSDLRSIKELTITNNSGVTDLKFLYDVPNLAKLTVKDYTGSLSGLESANNLTYLYFDNTGNIMNIDYTGLSGATNIIELHFLKPTDEEINKMCKEMSKGDYEKLSYMRLFGTEFGFGGQADISQNCEKQHTENEYHSTLTTVKSLNMLSQKTKQAVKTLYLTDNVLMNLDGIQEFINITKLYVGGNNMADALMGENSDNFVLSTYISKMPNLSVLFCPYNKISDADFNNITNTNIEYLHICSVDTLTELALITKLPKLKKLNAVKNLKYVLTDEVIAKLISLEDYYIDLIYGNQISLANIGSFVFLSSDVTDEQFLKLKDQTQIEILEITNCNQVSNSVLQEVLGSLTGLKRLYADGTQLQDFSFIKPENDKLLLASVLNTSIVDLSGLWNCSNFAGLRINTPSLNLKPYSSLISNICSKAFASNDKYKGGTYALGGITTTNEILSTLNGTPENINREFTCFNIYGGLGGKSIVDFTYTGLTDIYHMVGGSFKIPACIKNIGHGGHINALVDYSNVLMADSCDVEISGSAQNTTTFQGFNEVIFPNYNVIDIIGSYTKKLNIGRGHRDSYISGDVDIPAILTKASNLTELKLYGVKGVQDASIFKDEKLETLILDYSTISKLNLVDATESNLSKSLKTLTIKNSSLNGLDGLNNLPNITTLDLSNNALENYISVTKGEKKETISTSQYIVDSLPELTKVTLSGNSGLDNFKALTEKGFRETESGSKIFVKE